MGGFVNGIGAYLPSFFFAVGAATTAHVFLSNVAGRELVLADIPHVGTRAKLAKQSTQPIPHRLSIPIFYPPKSLAGSCP